MEGQLGKGNLGIETRYPFGVEISLDGNARCN
jgi:hypothetical protein